MDWYVSVLNFAPDFLSQRNQLRRQYHPRNKRGNFHFKHSQKQLEPPIVISVELSTTFVQMYPECSRKNILVPYPNTHGGWFNGKYAQEAAAVVLSSKAAQLPNDDQRPLAQFYGAGNHGTCTQLRRSMKTDYSNCAPSHQLLSSVLGRTPPYRLAMRLATFCPCPGGDSPSAKRMFDSLIAGCIPIILSDDFVWPFTNEFDKALDLDPATFSIRLNATDYDQVLLDKDTCKPIDPARGGLQAFLESISTDEIARLRGGVNKAGKLYSWYQESPDLPENPLRDGVLPDGGTAHFVVEALADRAKGSRWDKCAAERLTDRGVAGGLNSNAEFYSPSYRSIG